MQNWAFCAWIRLPGADGNRLAGVQRINDNSPVVAKSCAILETFRFIDNENTRGCSVYSDAKLVVDAIAKGAPFPWALSAILTDVSRLSSKNNVGIFFLPRKFNLLAHNLVQLATNCDFVGLVEQDDDPASEANSM